MIDGIIYSVNGTVRFVAEVGAEKRFFGFN